MHKYILAIDQSTSATKAMIFGHTMKIIARANVPHAQYYPQPGWVEHNPDEIYLNTLEAIRKVIAEASADPAEIAAIAITNQRETVVVWDKTTGKPVYNAVVWQCNRGAERCNQLKAGGWEERIREKTGLVVDPYFSATGISWILENVEGCRQKADDGNLLFGTIDCWLIWKLTQGQVHATDYTNACRTMLFNINTLKWDEEIMAELGIPLSMAPKVCFADDNFGKTTAAGILPKSIPVTGVLGDSHAALFGQNCFSAGMGKATYGTGSSIMMNIGSQPMKSPEGLVTSVGFALREKISFVYEGNIHCTGATIEWLKEELELIRSSQETEAIALSVPDTGGVYLVPAFAGLGAPYWDTKARALICGMTRGTRKAHIVRAALEAIAYQVKDLIDLMTSEAGIPLKELRVDGGPVRNKFLMRFQADVLKATINLSPVEEASALGVALIAAYSLGWLKFPEDMVALRAGNDRITGKMEPEKVEMLYSGWKKAVERTLYNQ